MLSLIAVIGKNRELGRDNKLLWHIPGDLPRFKKITTGHPVIMGRKTFESIGKPLPDRTNIIVSRSLSFAVSSVEAALEVAKHSPGSEEIFVIGGGNIFAQTINVSDRLYLTLVESQADADTFFPEYSAFTRVVAKESHDGYTYLTLEK